MDNKQWLGILFIILGILFAVFPLYASITISILVGIFLIAIGIAVIIDGCSIWSQIDNVSWIKILLGIIAIIFGLLFVLGVDAVSFLVGLEFYIMGFIMIFVGILCLTAKGTMSKVSAVLMIIMGIISVLLAFWAIAMPLYAALLVGICLIMYGILFLMGE